MTVAVNRSTVMLALEVSLSMCAADVYPNRLTIAQEASKRFIDGRRQRNRPRAGRAVRGDPNISPLSVFVTPRSQVTGTDEEFSYQPDVIVLLTDGASNRGVLPLVAARAARDRGVRVYTIGFGTTNPAVMRCSPDRLGGDEFANRIARGGFGIFSRGFGGGSFLMLSTTPPRAPTNSSKSSPRSRWRPKRRRFAWSCRPCSPPRAPSWR